MHNRKKVIPLSDGCSHCGQRFITQRVLERHMIAEHNAPKAKCTYCEEEFEDYMTLMLHVEKHHQGCCFPCLLCEKTFDTRQTWRRHMVTHMLEETIVCEGRRTSKIAKGLAANLLFPFCHFKWVVLSKCFSFYLHLDCGKEFKNKVKFQRHRPIHNAPRSHQCPYCEMAFSNTSVSRNLIVDYIFNFCECWMCDITIGTFCCFRSWGTTFGFIQVDACKSYVNQYWCFRFWYSLKYKLRILFFIGENPHVCELCGKGEFSHTSSLFTQILQ